MKRSKTFFINALIMSGTSIVLRIIGLLFNIYLSKTIGATGMGLFQLVMSVYVMAITIAMSGIGIASVRVISEQIALNENPRPAIRKCIIYALLFGTLAFLIVYFNANTIAQVFLKDVRVVKALKIMCIGLPFLSVVSVFNGYFAAVRRVMKSSLVQIVEQIVKMAAVVILLATQAQKGIEYACLSVVVGGSVGEVVSFIFIYILYRKDSARYSWVKKGKFRMRRILSISLPVACSGYLRSGLSTANQIMIPIGLTRHGLSQNESLAQYGIINAMVFPLIQLPQTFLYAFSGLLIPELSESVATKDHRRIGSILTRVFKCTMLFSIGVFGLLICFHDFLGMSLYGNTSVAQFLFILSPLAVLMYLDCVVDSVLSGLNQQVSCMYYNIIESIINTILIVTLLPKFGIGGYLCVILIGKGLNMILSVRRLVKVTDLKVSLSEWIFYPMLSAFLSIIIISGIIKIMGQSFLISIICMLLYLVLYMLFLNASRCFTKSDLMMIKQYIK